MGAGGSALRLQPQVQQAVQRRVPHALRPHLPEAVPASPLGSECNSELHSISSSITTPRNPTTDVPHLYFEEKGAYTLSVHIYLPYTALFFFPSGSGQWSVASGQWSYIICLLQAGL